MAFSKRQTIRSVDTLNGTSEYQEAGHGVLEQNVWEWLGTLHNSAATGELYYDNITKSRFAGSKLTAASTSVSTLSLKSLGRSLIQSVSPSIYRFSKQKLLHS